MKKQITVEIDWDGAPRWAQYAAMDSDGKMYWSENPPISGKKAWIFDSPTQPCGDDVRYPDWQDTLMERPKTPYILTSATSGQTALSKAKKALNDIPDDPEFAEAKAALFNAIKEVSPKGYSPVHITSHQVHFDGNSPTVEATLQYRVSKLDGLTNADMLRDIKAAIEAHLENCE